MQKSLMILAVIGLVLAYFLRTDTTVVENNTAPNVNKTNAIINGQQNSAPKNSQSNVMQTQSNAYIPAPKQGANNGNLNDKVRHIDMLSEDMKQAIRDKLMLHGPMKEVKRADGLTEIRANGRYTQMPVAVQMPDGTVQIKEYSEIPK